MIAEENEWERRGSLLDPQVEQKLAATLLVHGEVKASC